MGHVQGIIDSRPAPYRYLKPTAKRQLDKQARKRDFQAAIVRGIKRFEESSYIPPNQQACAQFVRQSVNEAGLIVARKRAK